MVGYKFCEKFIAAEHSSNFELVVYGEEPRPAYDRIHLSEFFSGSTEEDLSLAGREWYENNGITLHSNALVSGIDRKNKKISIYKGGEESYDYLVIATGSHPFVPPIPGVNKQGVFVYRTIEDLENIMSYGKRILAKGKREAAVLGGGLLGLEAAKALQDMGLKTHVIELAPRLMARQLDDEGGQLLLSSMESMGLQVHLSKMTSEIAGNGAITEIKFNDGTSLDVDMLLISAGIKPRDELAKDSGITVGPRGGILVDDTMKTSDDAVFAIGEVALYNEMIYGLAAPGYSMAEVAISQILGGDKRMVAEVDMSTKLKLMGVEVASFGDHFCEGVPHQSITYLNRYRGIYKRINVTEDGKKLLGGMLVGDSSEYNLLLQYVLNEMPLPEDPESLILPAGKDGGDAAGSLDILPDSAIICSCESVTKGEIINSVAEDDCSSVKEVCACTKAGTGCGGCKPLVTDLVADTLAKCGKEVSNHLCDHFAYERHELYDIVKVRGIKSFNEALDAIGKGDGCETCKPALASIFASIYNETANRQDTIQDTNDRFLANIQRNGSYSVVPRVPGGEITPDKLIVLGKVAKKYDLYTKITGGQRIDLFGARMEDLPLIWEDLIEAGFESGHAYGKALRTVKSCVGSTWCRYGMNESVSFAIMLEERYRGIRSPHKLKGGVSGCIRECAEARCKDFGVIATEDGWNLYIGGNGGANPKHAILFAEGLDDETCVRYIDRYLMFYIRTAKPLMRTAPWLEKLEGGVEYLREVIVDDKLGICDELDEQMEYMVGTYECEWKQAVEDPAIRSRFSHYVNSDEGDETMEFVSLRDQKMPAPWA